MGWARRPIRGSVMPIFAVMSLPMLMSVGVGVDMTRMTLARSALQSAVDGAALAAAAAGGYSKSAGSVADANATSAANNYFNGNYTHGGQGPSVTPAGTPAGTAIVPQITTPPANSSGYKVTVSAQGTMNTALLGVARLIGGGTSNASINTVVIQAHATANNTTTPGTAPKLVLNTSNPGSTAADWNAAYIYAVPPGTEGVAYDFAYIPRGSELYRVGTNCPAENKSANPTQYCYKPSAQNCSPIEAHDFADFPNTMLDAPIAMVFFNVTNGRASVSDVIAEPGSSYGAGPQSNMNYYGARFGSCQVFMTAFLSAGQSPSTYADSGGKKSNTSASILNYINENAINNHISDPVTNSIILEYLPIHEQKTDYSEVTKLDFGQSWGGWRSGLVR